MRGCVHQLWAQGEVDLAQDALYVEVVNALMGNVEGRAGHVFGELLGRGRGLKGVDESGGVATGGREGGID